MKLFHCHCFEFIAIQADAIIWDFEKRKMHAKLTLHMVKVEALAFSPNDKYLVSLGGEDDGRYWTIFVLELLYV